jgi:SAM-dependent methyltransferase
VNPHAAQYRVELENYARRLGGAAHDTILYEYFDKHLAELALIDAALPARGGAVLDIGGGLGTNLYCLRRVRADVRAVLVDRFEEYDDNNRMGTAAAALPMLEEAGIEVAGHDFWPTAALPFEDGAFDVVTIFDVVEHLPGSPLPLLEEARRLLRPDGTCIISGPNAASLVARLKLLAGRHPYIDFDAWLRPPYYSHYREYTRTEYGELLRLAGFELRRTVLSLGPWPARVRHRYHGRKHGFAAPVTWAIYAAAAMQWLLPPLRHSVYCIGRTPA